MENPQINLDTLAVLSKLLKRKQSRKYYAKRLGVSVETVEKHIAEIKRIKKEEFKESYSKKEDLIKGTFNSVINVQKEPNGHKELAIVHNINLKVFSIVNYWSKSQKDGTFTSSVFCKRKQAKDYSAEDFKSFLKKYKSNYTPVIKPSYSLKKEVVDVEVSVSDYHLAKKYCDELNLNVKKRAEKFFEIVKKLVLKTTHIYNVDEIVFPISNDFFHTDTYFNTSTMGTPQDVIAEYDEEYEVGFDVLVKSIKFLLSSSKKVKVILVPGNHDRTKSFYLAHGLQIYFRDEKRISFLRTKENEKGIMLGTTFIGYHHGNCKIEQLPLLFATHPLYSSDFGDANFREIHTGDKHHYMAKEVKGVRIQQMPSMSGNDRWHKDHLFVNNIRAALLLIYNKETGKSGEFEERI